MSKSVTQGRGQSSPTAKGAVMVQASKMTNAGDIIAVLIAAALGWLANSFLKVGKAEFKEAIARVDALSKEVDHLIGRAEFDKGIAKFESQLEKLQVEMKAEMKAFRVEMQTELKASRLETRAEWKELKDDLKGRS